MFHAQCRELSLSTGAFSHSHAYDRSVAAPGPYTIQHWGGKPLHQRMPIVVAPRTHVHGYPILHLVSVFTSSTNKKWLSISIREEPIKNYLPYSQKYVTSTDDIITLGIQTSLSPAPPVG